MKFYKKIITSTATIALATALVGCGSGAGTSSTNNGTTVDFAQVAQVATPSQANSCLTITNPNVSLGAWWTSGTFNVTNTCTTAQPASGVQVLVSSTGVNLSQSSFSLNSVSGISFPAPVYWAAATATTTAQTVAGLTDLLLTVSTDASGVINPNASMAISFGYNPNGQIPGAFNFSLSNAAPVHTGSINLSINTSNLSSFCKGSTNCNIPVVLSGQGGQLQSTVATITNANVGGVINQQLINLNPGSYTLTANASGLPESVTFSAAPITVTSGGTVNESATFSVPVATLGNITATLTNPNSKVFVESSFGVNVVDATGASVAAGNLSFGQAYSFTGLLAKTYTLQTYGLADAVQGIYYSPISTNANVTVGNTTNVALAFSANTALVTENLVESGLAAGDTATITITDSKAYTYNKITITGNGSSVTTPLKLLSGDSITLNVSSSGKYQAINPVTYTVANGNAISLNFSKTPTVTKVYSAYKDISINTNWNTDVISTLVNPAGGVFSATQPLVANLPSTMPAITWAFATGDCTAENWGGMTATTVASANVPLFTKYNKNYIISTGGAAGVFTCSSNAGMLAFVQRYMSANMLGLDFDIEGGQTQAQMTSLVSTLKYIQGVYPNLRISFTLASLADSSGSGGNLNSLGAMVINTANAAGLNYIVNLMVMDYGSPLAVNCVVANGSCQMAQSAIQAAKNVSAAWSIPLSKIELTPMIGNNDTSGEVFTVTDATTLANYVTQNGLAGLHFWSYDRDTPCATNGSASPTCSYVPGVTTSSTQFSSAFYNGLAN